MSTKDSRRKAFTNLLITCVGVLAAFGAVCLMISDAPVAVKVCIPFVGGALVGYIGMMANI